MRCCVAILHFIQITRIRCCRIESTGMYKCMSFSRLMCKIYCMAYFEGTLQSASVMLPMSKNIGGSRRSTGLMFRRRKSSPHSSLSSSPMKTAVILTCNF